MFMEVEMSRRNLMLLSGVLVILFTGCSSPHHGNYSRGQGDYWNKASQDVSGLVEKHVRDPEKVKQVNAVMGEIITEIKSAREQHGSSRLLRRRRVVRI